MHAPLSLLLAEDEPLIAMMLEDYVDELGHRIVANVDSVEEALEAVGRGGFDIAILDVHLRDHAPCWPIADALSDRGIAFLIASGGHIETPPERHRDAPALVKPYTLENVRDALRQLGQ